MGTMQCKLWHVGFFVASSYGPRQSFNGLVYTKNKWVWVQDVSWKLRKQKCLPKLWSWNPRWFLSAESFPPLIIWNISLKHLSETNKEKEIPLTEPLIEAEWKYIILRRFREKPEIQQHWKDFSLLPLRDVLLRKRMHSFGFCPNEGGRALHNFWHLFISAWSDLEFVATGGHVKFCQLCKLFQKTTQFLTYFASLHTP